ncbi:H1 protein, partial [Illadopsis cleaveri]|nr:H1 protein [Illadopsis cleaveri]
PLRLSPSRSRRKAASGSKARKPAGPSVTELITKAVSASKERKGLTLAALKKALAAGGYNVENSRIKLGLKSLVGKGVLVQTRGIGASGSFCLSKKPGEAKEASKKKKPAATKPKKPTSAAKSTVTAKKSSKKVKSAAKKAAKTHKKVTNVVRPKKAVAAEKSPAKAKAMKPKAAKPKVAKAKKATPKKK